MSSYLSELAASADMPVTTAETPGTVERQLRTTSAGAALLARLPLSKETLDDLLRSQGTPLLHKRLQALGVYRMGQRMQIAAALKDHVEGRSPIPHVPLPTDDTDVASPTRAQPHHKSVPSSPHLETDEPHLQPADAAVVAAAVGCSSPAPNLIRAFCATVANDEANCSPSPLATVTNVKSEPRARKSPNAARGRTKPSRGSESRGETPPIATPAAEARQAESPLLPVMSAAAGFAEDASSPPPVVASVVVRAATTAADVGDAADAPPRSGAGRFTRLISAWISLLLCVGRLAAWPVRTAAALQIRGAMLSVVVVAAFTWRVAGVWLWLSARALRLGLLLGQRALDWMPSPLRRRLDTLSLGLERLLREWQSVI